MMDLAAILKKTPPHSTVSIPRGEYEGGLTLRVSGVTLRAAPGTVTIRGGARFGLKIDGANDTTLDGLRFVGSGGHGVFAVNAHGLTFLNLITDDHATNGILTGSCSSVAVRGCKCRRNGSHGIYFSERGADWSAVGNVCGANGRCGCQCNAHPGGARALVVTDNDFRGNANCGLQLAAIVGGTVARNDVTGNRQTTVVWDDGSGKAAACQDIDLTQQDGQVHVSKWCKNIRTKPGAAVPI